jgi:superfamily II DNA or RNA helicase
MMAPCFAFIHSSGDSDMATFAPSSYQQAIFDFVTNGSGSAVIEAVAGSGKTTTILQALKLIPESDSVLMLAFNKSIADELKAKAPPHIDVKTFNGLGHSILGSRLGRVTLDTYKARNIVKSVMDEFDYREFG